MASDLTIPAQDGHATTKGVKSRVWLGRSEHIAMVPCCPPSKSATAADRVMADGDLGRVRFKLGL